MNNSVFWFVLSEEIHARYKDILQAEYDRVIEQCMDEVNSVKVCLLFHNSLKQWGPSPHEGNRTKNMLKFLHSANTVEALWADTLVSAQLYMYLHVRPPWQNPVWTLHVAHTNVVHIPVSGQFQLRTLFLLPEGVRLRELRLYCRQLVMASYGRDGENMLTSHEILGNLSCAIRFCI